MAFKYYNLLSDIQNGRSIDGLCSEFIQKLEKETGNTFTQVSLDEIIKQDFSVIYVKSGNVEDKFLRFYKNLKSPVLLLTEGYNNSLAASLEILSFLKSKGIKGEILHGSIPYISKRLLFYKKINDTNNLLKEARLGVIGKPSEWLIASEVNYQKIKSKTGIEIVDIDIEELISEVKAYGKIQLDKINQLSGRKLSDSQISEALKNYGALRNLVQKYKLNGLTVRCFDLFNTIKSTSCLALSFLNDEGIISGCEGDIPSLISMFILNKLTEEKVFMANPTSINVEDNSIILSHCTVPTSMCSNYSLDTHFESSLGIGIKGEIPAGTATIFKLSSTLNEYFVSSMEIKKNSGSENSCLTQIKAVLKEDVKYFLKAPLGNHHLIISGDHTELIDSFLNQK